MTRSSRYRFIHLLFVLLWLLLAFPRSNNSASASGSKRLELENESRVLKKLLKRYDKYTRPLVSTLTHLCFSSLVFFASASIDFVSVITLGAPTLVNISMAVQAFSQIRESNMEFEVFMYKRQEWNDPRLAHGYRATLSLAKERVNEIWTPDTYFNNANEYTVYTQNKLALISGNGDVYYSGRVKVKAACQMNLENFPLDVQRCSLIMESFAYTVDQLNIEWKEDNPVRIFNVDLAEFDVVNTEIKEHNATYVPGLYKNLVVTFTFRRRMGFYFIQFYIPCIVMVMLSWISFWMDRYYIGERVSLGITTVLTIVFLLGSSNSTMPRVSYAKAIDWYLIGSFIFVFSTLVTDLLVYRFSRLVDSRVEGKEGKERTHITFNCKHGFKPTYIAEASGEVHVVSYEEEKANRYIKEALQNCCLPVTCQARNIKQTEKPDISVIINKCCRIMYPVAFTIFNVVYWSSLFMSR